MSKIYVVKNKSSEIPSIYAAFLDKDTAGCFITKHYDGEKMCIREFVENRNKKNINTIPVSFKKKRVSKYSQNKGYKK